MQAEVRGSGPELELVTVTEAAMAIVATHRHVYPERAVPATGNGIVHGTASVPSHARPGRGLEPKQAQHLLHRDLGADLVEIDAGRVSSSLSGQDRSVLMTSVPFPLNSL
jgi:hypothetical protein